MEKPGGLYFFENLLWGWRIGRISSILGRPGLSWCGCCKTRWTFVPHHTTNYKSGHGCFPLCEACWKELTIEDRLPYYRDLYEGWLQDEDEFGVTLVTPDTWNQIEEAVRNGG